MPDYTCRYPATTTACSASTKVIAISHANLMSKCLFDVSLIIHQKVQLLQRLYLKPNTSSWKMCCNSNFNIIWFLRINYCKYSIIVRDDIIRLTIILWNISMIIVHCNVIVLTFYDVLWSPKVFCTYFVLVSLIKRKSKICTFDR